MTTPTAFFRRFFGGLGAISLLACSTWAWSGQAKQQLRVTVTVVGQCQLQLKHGKSRALHCSGRSEHAARDMHVEWHETNDGTPVLTAHVSF